MVACKWRNPPKEAWLGGSKWLQSTVEGLGRCGGRTRTIERATLQSFKTATEISAGEITGARGFTS